MSVINGFFLGLGYISSPSEALLATPYDRVTLYGGSSGSGATVDKLRIMRRQLTATELAALSETDEYTWDADTILYAEFDNNLSGGNLSGTTQLDGCKVFRTESGATQSELIEDFDYTTYSFYDYTAKKNLTYNYTIYPHTSTEGIAALTTNNVTITYEGWVFIDETTGESYLFDLNMSSGDINTNTDLTVYDNGYSKFPAYSTNNKQYDSGSISCRMGYLDSSCDYIDTTDLFDDVRDFMANGHIKVMKDRKGNAWKVMTNALGSNMDDRIPDQIITLNFNFTQVGDA